MGTKLPIILPTHWKAPTGRSRPSGMIIVAWIGGVLSVLGLAGVLWCIRKAAWLRKADLDDETVKIELNTLIFGHMASIGAAFLGLGLLTAGLLLG